MFANDNKRGKPHNSYRLVKTIYQEVLKAIHGMQVHLWTASPGVAAGPPHACIAPRALSKSPLRLWLLQESPKMLPEAVLSSLNEHWGFVHSQTPSTCHVDTSHSSAMLSLF